MVVFNKKILSNGLTVLHEKRDVDVTTVIIAVPYGAMCESASEKGISHLIEHLCFKGTEKRTTKQISNELESVGGRLNAFTHEETTAYYVKLPSDYIELAIDVLSDIFFNASFPESDIEREKNVVCEEIKMYHDDPMSYAEEKLKENLYEEPYGMSVAGNINNVLSFSRDFLLSKHRKYYIPENAILCVVGNNSFEDVVKFAEKYAGIERSGEKIEKLNIKKKNNCSSEKREGVVQANLAMGVHVPFGDQREYVIKVFNSIFGQGMSSKLFEEIREKRGLVYSIRSDLDIGRNYAYMLISAGTANVNCDEIISLTKKVFNDMKNISEEELAEAKIRTIGDRKVGTEGSSDTALNLLFSEMASCAEDYYKFDEKINSVTLDDIKKLVDGAEFSTFVLNSA